MGVIRKQAFNAFIYSYIGVVLGLVTSGILFPKFLSKEEIGLTSLLLKIAMVTSWLCTLGFPTIRFFPYFKTENNNHNNGYLSFNLLIALAGFCVFALLYIPLGPWIVEHNSEKSMLFAKYHYYVIPMTFFFVTYYMFDFYARSLRMSVIGTSIRDFYQRLMVLAVTLIYIVIHISFHQFLFLYVFCLCIPTVFIALYLYAKKSLNFQKPNWEIVTPHLRKEMVLVSFFSILTSLSSLLVTSLDGIMINQIIGLADTGVYSIAAYFATLIVIPSRTINNASNIVVSEAFKAGNLDEVKKIYYKSCLVQFIIAIYLFLGLSSNMDFINWMLPEYIAGNGVIIFLGLSGVIDMSTGINTAVILFSKYYRFNMYALLLLVVLVVIANLIFIPIYGITGAAIAALIAMFIFNLVKYIFILVKFKFQPFSYKFLLILVLAGCLYWFLSLLKLDMHPMFVLVIKGGLITVVMGGFLYFTRLSSDVNALFDKVLKRKSSR